MSGSRVGLGVDVHRFATGSGRPLVLGGVRVPNAAGLAGHSDADALAHALADAMLGAAALGDLGDLFPDDDPRFRGADSLVLLRDVAERVRAAGFALVNADCTVVAEKPHLAPLREEMGRRLAEAAGGPVHVKATRPEGLGALGRVEGIACVAVALLGELPAGERTP